VKTGHKIWEAQIYISGKKGEQVSEEERWMIKMSF
jgi:hypothetical protein